VVRNSRRVFGVLDLRSRAGRRLAISMLALAGVGMLTVAPAAPSHARPATTLAASGGWLDRLNSWRNGTRVPTLTENTTWSSGAYAHSLYMVKNDLVTHYETVGTPYYTAAGDTAARNGNIQVSSSTSSTDESAIDWWMGAPYHAMGLMDPRLATTGFGSYREVKSGWQEGATVDTLRGNPFTGGQYPVYFPGNGSSEPLTSYSGNEFPDPLTGACAGYSVPTGLPVFVQVGGNVATTVGPVHSFTGNGTPLAHCVLDSSSPNGSYLTNRGAVVLIPQAPLQTGVTYVVALTVNGLPYTWSFTVGAFVPPVYCTGVSAVLAPPTQAAAGAPVTLTATATGCPNPRYRFWIAPPSGAWSIAQDYSASATFNWTTTGIPGAYRLEVDVKDTSSAATYDKVANFNYTITGAATTCTAATLSPNLASPQAPSTQITWTASAAGCPNPRYRFWEFDPGSRWSMVVDYSAANTFTWNSPNISGSYAFEVDVRDVSETSTYDVVSNKTYNLLSSGVCGSALLSTAPTTPSATGVSVTLTGSSAGCPNPRYRFWIQDPGRNWSMVQDYSAASTHNWTQTGLKGSYRLEVDVRDATSPQVYESVYNLTYTVNGCSAAGLSGNPTTAAHGTPITLTGTATCLGTANYKFWVQAPGGSWQVVQQYGPTNTFTWTPATAGTYNLEVDVRNQTGTDSYETVKNLTYTVS
jgi:hypothetical protein